MKKRSFTSSKKQSISISIAILFLLISNITSGQKAKKDTLKTEEITVVKPYTPKISNATKIKSEPIIDDADVFQKETVNYSIFSIPVASTFIPSKGKPKGVPKVKKEILHDNYVLAGFGNYMTPLVEAFLNYGNPRYNDYGVFLKYQSSQGGINDVLLEDGYSDIVADAYYKQFERDFDWKIIAGYKRNRTNYYGLPTAVSFSDNVLSAIDEKQIYNTIYVGGNINFEESAFKNADAKITYFTDNYSSSEYQVLLKPNFEIPISTEIIKAEVIVDYMSGKFKQSYLNIDEIKYGFVNFGFNPSLDILRNDLNIKVGARIYYSLDLENDNNQFRAYPNITASYQLIEDTLFITGGVIGDLTQNTYRDFVDKNPFVSPTLEVKPSDEQYKAFAGAKGKIASNIGYQVNLSYSHKNDQAFYKQNPIQTDGSSLVRDAFQAGNSFYVVYDDLKTIQGEIDLSFDISKEFDLSAGFIYSNYSTTNELKAWNMPELQATIAASYQTSKWFADAKLFFRGETNDFNIPFGISAENGQIVKNDSFIDLNLNGGYIFDHRLTVFGRVNNAIGSEYQRFLNYPVQSFQFLAGITYKFDFE